MADIALVTTGKINIVESIEQMTLPAGENIAAGAAVRLDTTTGKFTGSNATSEAEARIYGIAVATVVAGRPVTAVRKGVLEGFDLSAKAYDLAIFLSNTDATLADAAGSTSVTVGRVIPVQGQTLGTALDKLLFVDL